MFRNEYNFFEFRTSVDDKKVFNELPLGLYCDGQSDKKPVPKISKQFSYTQETIFDGGKTAKTTRVYHSYIF